MNKQSFRANVLLIIAFMMIDVVVIHAAEPKPPALRIQSEVTQWDSLGRIKEMEARTRIGTCTAEITYGKSTVIQMFVVTPLKFENLGLTAIGGTADTFDIDLRKLLDTMLEKHCLPFIIPGYAVI